MLSRSSFRFLAAVLFGATTLPGCAEEERPPVGVVHLFERPAASVELADLRLPGELDRVLGRESVWLQGDTIDDLAWRFEEEPGESRTLVAPTRFPAAAPRRVSTRKTANRPGAGRPVNADETIELAADEVAIGPRGATVLRSEDRATPARFRLAYPTRAEPVRAELIGDFPTGGRVASRRKLELGAESRRVAFAPVPARLAWTLELPHGGRLVFGYGLRRLEIEPSGEHVRILTRRELDRPVDTSVEFRLEARVSSDEPRVLWSSRLTGDDARSFHEGAVDLAELGGRNVELALVTVAAGGTTDPRLTPFWSEPVIDAPDPGARPTIVVVLIDTLRADAVGCYGNPRDVTPNLDAIAAEGARYADLMSAAPWTLPSHVSLFSSLYPSQHGVWFREEIPADVATLAEVLRAADYHTFAFTEGMFVHPRFGLDQGFDRFQTGKWDVEHTVGRAIDSLRDVRGPAFVFLQTYEAHTPYDPPGDLRRRLVEPYDGPLARKVKARGYRRLEGDATEADLRYIRQLYDAEIARVDREIGRLVRFLRDAGRWDDTLFVVTSDHGEEFEDHGGFGHGETLYQEMLHVPLILHQRGRFEGGSVYEHAVHAVDLAPTLASAAGATIPSSWVGEVLGSEPAHTGRALFSPFYTLPDRTPASAYREGGLKFIELPADAGPETRLFDLSSDPGEHVDLLGAGDQERWREEVANLWKRYAPLGEAERAAPRPAQEEAMKGVGYVGDD